MIFLFPRWDMLIPWRVLFQLFQYIWERALRESLEIARSTSFLLKICFLKGMVLVGIPLAGTDPIPSSFAVKVWLQFVTAYPQFLHFCISSNRQGDSFGAKKLKLKEKNNYRSCCQGWRSLKFRPVLKHLKLIN